MPRIVAVATANPPHLIHQAEAKEFAQSIYPENKLLKRLEMVFDNAMVEKRYLSASKNWLAEKHSFTELNDLYISTTLVLSEKVTLNLANQCKIDTQEFDIVFFITTTGLSTPSIDARLFNTLRFNPHIKRIPIWGLGCAGGACAIARAHDYLKAYPTHRALIIAVELCSLSFQLGELSKENIISDALFGDGAAACALYGDEVPFDDLGRAQPVVLDSLSTIYKDTLDVMSWRITSEGFKVQLSRDIPTIVTSLVKPNFETLLNPHELTLQDLKHFIFHPGGAKVLKAYSEGLNVPIESFSHSYSVLKDYGNMSSATVFFVLKRFLESTQNKSKDYGLLGALGPGFSSELLLLQWK